jgi:hypothetical protein
MATARKTETNIFDLRCTRKYLYLSVKSPIFLTMNILKRQEVF